MLGLKIKVDNVEKTNIEIANCFINIYENRLPIFPTTFLNNHDIGLSHLAKEPMRSAKEIISSRYHRTNGAPIDISSSIGTKNNKKPNDNKWFKTKNTNVKYPSSNIVITGLFNDLDEPLFWRHDIPLDASVTIFDQDGSLVPSNKYKVVVQADPLSNTHAALRSVIAHSLKTNLKENKYYLVSYKDSSNNTIQEALDQQPLFEKFPSGSPLFTWSQNNGASLFNYWIVQDGATFSFTLPDDYTHTAFQERDTCYLRAELPESLAPNEPWFPVVPNATWIRSNSLYYKIPEWDLQNFNTTSPYLNAVDDVAAVVGKHLIKVSNLGVLKSHTTGMGTSYIDILLYQENEELPSKALTNNESKDKSLVSANNSILWEYTNLSTIGEQGLIYSPVDLRSYSWCYASYSYKSGYKSITLKDLNPFRNPDLKGKTVVYYLVPYFQGQQRAVEYLVYDQEQNIIESSQGTGLSNNTVAAPIVLNKMVYEPPVGYKEGRASDNTMGLQVRVISDESGDNFISHYVLGQKYIILGEFSFPVTLDESPSALISDIRKESIANPIELRKANPDLLSSSVDSIFNEIIPIPELTNLQEYRCHWGFFKDYNKNSVFSKKDFQNRIQMMKRAGITSVLSYEGVPDISIKSIDMGGTSITLNWFPVSGFDKNTPVNGILYKGTTSSNITTQVASLGDLAKTSEVNISFNSNEEWFFQLIPSITIDSVVYLGPSSNILYFSSKT